MEQDLKAARLEITKLQAVIGSSNIVNQPEVNNWIKPKNYKARDYRFPAHDPTQLKLRNRHIGSCSAESRFAEAKEQWSQHKRKKLKKTEKKDSIAWKQLWEEKGTNAS